MNILLISSILLISFFQYLNCVILPTKQGSLKGEVSFSRNGRSFYAFYNIPYAEPPIGDLRFKSPVPPKSWNGIRDATVLPPACISYTHQKEIVGQEDCLYLNVYTPKITNDTFLLPVMVFIYGGNFMYGNALPDKYGAHYFMDKDVVLITFHYRLGVFGFLSTEDDIIPGNYGLKDQVAVLQWVQNYVDAFGGDKNRVTIFGGSSGGTSASLILISPLAKGLFHRVISQSDNPFSTKEPGSARLDAWKIAAFTGCNDNSTITSEALLACLKQLPAEKLVIHNMKLYIFSQIIPPQPWGFVIESEKIPGAFLIDEPRKLFARKTDIPWIFGMNSDEGGMFTIFTYFSPELSVLDELDKNYEKYFPRIFRYERYAKSSEHLVYLTKMIKEHYFGDKSVRENPHGFSKMLTYLPNLPQFKTKFELYKGPKYAYCYSHRNKESFAKMYGSHREDMGVIHGDELISMFNWSSVITPVTDGIDLVVSKQVLRLWTNFAAKGDPNDDDNQIWRPIDTPDINHLHIKDGILEMKEELFKSEYEFLEKLRSQIYE